MKYVAFVSLLCLGVMAFACGPHKPAYEDVKLETRGEGKASSATGEENPAAKVAQEVQSNAQSKQQAQPVVLPEFFDGKTGQIKDLPNYSKARLTNSQYGNYNNIPMAILLFQAKGTLQDAVTFYEQEIKKNGWTVVSNTNTPGDYEWVMRKGEKSQASVSIKQETPQSIVVISVSRSEAPDSAK